MKTRISYVSNSSSSSFIVAVKDSNKCPLCNRKDPNFLDFMDKQTSREDYYCDETKLDARGYADVIKYIKNNVGYDDNENGEEEKYWDSILTKIKQASDSGKEVGYVSIAYGDDSVETEYHHQIRNGNVEKIWGDH